MTNFYLSERFEKPIGNCNRYDNNGKVNAEIAKAFKESIAVFAFRENPQLCWGV